MLEDFVLSLGTYANELLQVSEVIRSERRNRESGVGFLSFIVGEVVRLGCGGNIYIVGGCLSPIGGLHRHIATGRVRN